MQRYTIFFIIVNALHVSGGFSAHHQELKNCTHSIGYVHIPVYITLCPILQWIATSMGNVRAAMMKLLQKKVQCCRKIGTFLNEKEIKALEMFSLLGKIEWNTKIKETEKNLLYKKLYIIQ
jgi:hypothetical protein